MNDKEFYTIKRILIGYLNAKLEVNQKLRMLESLCVGKDKRIFDIGFRIYGENSLEEENFDILLV